MSESLSATSDLLEQGILFLRDAELREVRTREGQREGGDREEDNGQNEGSKAGMEEG